MKLRKRNAFTLIELIATLVIMAIIALIVTPLVMNVIRSARISADKRSIDAYGRSIELAIAGYLLDTGKFPTNVEQLTIEYSGNQVVCETTQINTDSSVYLAGCTVAGRSVENYTYGKEEVITYDAYTVGDEVTYNGVNYYVIENSDTTQSTVKLLKSEPLSVAEVNLYGGVGTDDNHVNKNACEPSDTSCYQTAFDSNGYGGMVYYTSEDCTNHGGGSGCIDDYESSDIKYVVDAWAYDKAPAAEAARLIYKNEIEIEERETVGCMGTCNFIAQYAKNDWLYSSDYAYWTMTPAPAEGIYSAGVYQVMENGQLLGNATYYYYETVVRPVIVLPKSAL